LENLLDFFNICDIIKKNLEVLKVTRFTIVLLGENTETHHTDDQTQAIAMLEAGEGKYQRGYVVDNNFCEICADFGFGEL
jgi:hypothetical protein